MSFRWENGKSKLPFVTLNDLKASQHNANDKGLVMGSRRSQGLWAYPGYQNLSLCETDGANKGVSLDGNLISEKREVLFCS